MELIDEFIQNGINKNLKFVRSSVKSKVDKCVYCNNIFALGQLISIHEVKDVYGTVYGRLYICKQCKERNEGLLREAAIEAAKQNEKNRIEEERRRIERKRMLHDSKYESIIGLKILDVLSNKYGKIHVILEDRKKLVIYYEESEEYDESGGIVVDIEAE